MSTGDIPPLSAAQAPVLGWAPARFGQLLAKRITAALMWAAVGMFGLSVGLLSAQAAPPRQAQLASPAASAVASAPASPIQTGVWLHAISAFQPPKYPANYAHFDYVNPDAPKGGLLRLSNPDRRTSFDKYNPYTLKGVAPAAMEMLVFETLCTFSMDEPGAMYGLLAEAMYVAPDLRSMSVRLRPEARFNDGSPVTAADVVHSFKQMSGKRTNPYYSAPYAGIADAVALDERSVRFDFKEARTEFVFTLGNLPVFSRRWGGGKPFDQIVTDWPIASGPYTLAKAEMPSRLELKRLPNYWAANMPARRGLFNFDRILYRMYKDHDSRREAFKAGEFDIMRELRASHFARSHRGAKWDDGRIIKQVLPTQIGSLFQAFNFNLRRAKFQDVRVREALNLAWDFEAYNKYRTFRPDDSLFSNTDFAAEGPPSPGELKLLEPFRAELPPRVFGPAYRSQPSDAYPNALRDKLKRAAQLLAEAGWKVAADGWVRNAQGETLDIEYVEPQEIGRFAGFERNLKKLGVRYSERLVDYALYRRRIEAFDFDLIIIVEGKFTLPNPAELDQYYASGNGKQEGGSNYRGVDSKAADALIAHLAKATTIDELRTASRALDRVVMWNFWQIPMLYSNSESISYWNRFGIPKVRPKYFSIDSIPDVHSLPWPVWAWWDLGSEGAAPAAKH